MNSKGGQGILVISIDLDTATSTSEPGTVERLADATRQHRIPVTWVARRIPAVAAAGRPLAGLSNADFGLLADASWVGPRRGRTVLARQLQQRVGETRAAGLPLSTLALSGTRLTQHLDLLVKHRLPWIRLEAQRAVRRGIRPENLRYGVWQTVPALRLPHPRTLSRTWTGLALRRLLTAAAQQRSLLHVQLDATRLAGLRRPMDMVNELLQVASDRRAAGQLTLMTLGSLAEHLRPVRQQRPMHSILRRAA